MSNIQSQIAYIRSQLASCYSPEEATDLAFWIVEETTGLSRADISAGKDTQNISNIEIILKRLQKKEPIQYIFGHTLWFGLDLLVNSATLIPRPETAELVQLLLDSHPADEPFSVLDIGTGSGCIAIALKKRRPNWQIYGLDVSAEALQVAAQNAIRNKVEVNWLHADIFDPNLQSKILNLQSTISNLQSPISNLQSPISNLKCIISNPPYVLDSEKKTMDLNVLDYEPHTALFVPDNDPLRYYKRIVELGLSKYLYFEVNEKFASQVAQLLRENKYENIEIKRDIYEKERMVCGRIKE